MRLAPLLWIFVAAPFVATLVLNTVKPPLRLARQNLALRSTVISLADSARTSDGKMLLDPSLLRAGVERGRYYRLVSVLRDIERIPSQDKSDMLLFIPQSYELHWNMFDSDDRCTYVGLVAPAITELAHVDGMPAFGCDMTDQYNMQSYTQRTGKQTAADVTDTALCAKVRQKGFRKVMVVSPDAEGNPRRRLLECVS